MKTPRELLLEKHRVANPALDNVRRKALDAVFSRPALNWRTLLRQRLSEFLAKLWDELILPNRKTWAGLAAVWVMILGLSIASLMDSSSSPVYAAAEPLSRETIIALHQQRQELAELIQSPQPEPAEPPRRALQPRSCAQPQWLIG